MNLKLLETHTSTLIIVDMQTKLLNAIQKSKQIKSRSQLIIESANIFDLNLIITEQNPEKLGRTVLDIPDQIKYLTYSKQSFSCLSVNGISKNLVRNKTKSVILCGVETHICIQQTCLDMLQNGYQVYIATDAVAARTELDHSTAIKRMEACGATITTTESIIFELCKTAEHRNFKDISNIIKNACVSI